MNGGVVAKSIRETWSLTLICGLGAAVFEAVIVFAVTSFQDEIIYQIEQIEFARKMMEALLGADLGAGLGVDSLRPIAWAHPVLFTILWAHTITTTTRLPVGEIDRGTIDVLLGLPLSRPALFLTEAVVWLGSLAVVLGFAVAGNLGANAWLLEEPAPVEGLRVALVALNLFLLCGAVGAFGLLVSACSDRRGRAVGIVMGVVLAHFLWSVLGQFWPFAETYAWLGIMHYHRPQPLLQEGVAPYGDLAVLGALMVALGGAALAQFRRRDICTV